MSAEEDNSSLYPVLSRRNHRKSPSTRQGGGSHESSAGTKAKDDPRIRIIEKKIRKSAQSAGWGHYSHWPAHIALRASGRKLSPWPTYPVAIINSFFGFFSGIRLFFLTGAVNIAPLTSSVSRFTLRLFFKVYHVRRHIPFTSTSGICQCSLIKSSFRSPSSHHAHTATHVLVTREATASPIADRFARPTTRLSLCHYPRWRGLTARDL